MSFTVRQAESEDVERIKFIADANRDALGFTPRAKIEEAVSARRALIVAVLGQVVGFVLYRHRKVDQQTTLSDICVVKDWRDQGVGRLLISALYAECMELSRDFIQLKCPEDLRANHFYKHLGFRLVRIEEGCSRRLNVWCLGIGNTEAV